MSAPKYEVGFGKPPKGSRFRSGQSGNPGGRPKRLPSFRDVLQTRLADRVPVVDGDMKLMVTKQEALAIKLIDCALAGNQKAISAIIATCDTGQRDASATDDEANAALAEQLIEEEVERRLEQLKKSQPE
jgi:hypothetical protein